jgi:signal transduction histidine kinase
MDRIQQVLLNLLANARKFVRKNSGVISIETSYIKEPVNFLQISVGNNGNPISREAEQQLFKPFSKLDDPQKPNKNGYGLGLSICKQICENLGGIIAIERDRAGFTNFVFRVKVMPSPECDLIQPPSSRRILEMKVS